MRMSAASKEAVLIAIQNSQKFKLEAFKHLGNCITPQKHVSAHHRKPLSTISPCHCFIKQCPLFIAQTGLKNALPILL